MSQPLYAPPWWARWPWQLAIQVVFLLLYLLMWFHLVGGEPFIAPRVGDLWMLVALPAIVGWGYCQMAFGCARVLKRLGADGAAYSILILWNLLMTYRFFEIPSEYATDLIKFTTRH